MISFSCPLCSVSLTPATLESHLREELNLPHLRCRHCLLDFTSEDTAHEHFSGAFAKHPGMAPSLLRLNGDADKEARLEEMARLARGGDQEVEKRLCVCGQCRLLCREKTEQGPKQAHETNFENPALESSYRDGAPNEAVAQSDAWKEQPETLNQTEQPMMEASEPENQMMDVKPDLKDLKALVSTDGKVACIQCGLRVGKGNFKKHAIGAHSSVRPYNCNLCPHSEKTKSDLAKHQRKQHGSQLSADTFTYADLEAKINDLVEQCFGEAKDAGWAKLMCQPCERLINKMDLKNHIAVVHLQKALHSCKLCPFTSRDISAGSTNRHLKKVHGQKPGPDTIDSSQAQHYAPVIKNMISQFFS